MTEDEAYLSKICPDAPELITTNILEPIICSKQLLFEFNELIRFSMWALSNWLYCESNLDLLLVSRTDVLTRMIEILGEIVGDPRKQTTFKEVQHFLRVLVQDGKMQGQKLKIMTDLAPKLLQISSEVLILSSDLEAVSDSIKTMEVLCELNADLKCQISANEDLIQVLYRFANSPNFGGAQVIQTFLEGLEGHSTQENVNKDAQMDIYFQI